MPRKISVKPKFFFEPWAAAKSTSHGEEPDCEGYPEEAAAALKDAWGRSDRSADWIIWGSQMCEPSDSTGYLSGDTIHHDGRGIIAVRRWLYTPEDAPTNAEVAQRIAACVTAFAGVGDPASFMSDARELLRAYVSGESFDPREDKRFVSLLARCVPPKEVKDGGYGEQPKE